MIRLACAIPTKITIAVSGGPDSQSLLSFCYNGRKDIVALHVNHRTQHSQDAQNLVSEYCREKKISLAIRYIPEETIGTELEWRNARLNIYREFTKNGGFVATGHHSGDLIEWFLLSSIHGEGKLMKPIDNEYNLIKPFLLTEKKVLTDWCVANKVPYIIDPTNFKSESNCRARLRQEVIPSLLKIHPGMATSIKNKLIKSIT